MNLIRSYQLRRTLSRLLEKSEIASEVNVNLGICFHCKDLEVFNLCSILCHNNLDENHVVRFKIIRERQYSMVCKS